MRLIIEIEEKKGESKGELRKGGFKIRKLKYGIRIMREKSWDGEGEKKKWNGGEKENEIGENGIDEVENGILRESEDGKNS